MSESNQSKQDANSQVRTGYHLPTYHPQSSYNDQSEPGGDRRSFVGFGGHPGFFGAPDTSQSAGTASQGGESQTATHTVPRKPVGSGSTSGTSA